MRLPRRALASAMLTSSGGGTRRPGPTLAPTPTPTPTPTFTPTFTLTLTPTLTLPRSEKTAGEDEDEEDMGQGPNAAEVSHLRSH